MILLFQDASKVGLSEGMIYMDAAYECFALKNV